MKALYSNRSQNGYVAALSVLLVGAIATAVVISLLVLGILASQQVGTEEAGIQARQLAHACVELALGEIQQDPGYTGIEVINIGSGQCRYVVDGTTVSTIGRRGTVRQRVEAGYTVDPLEVSVWIENP